MKIIHILGMLLVVLAVKAASPIEVAGTYR